jgi:hypothetical protein
MNLKKMKPEEVLKLMELLKEWRNGNQEVVKEILERTLNVE